MRIISVLVVLWLIIVAIAAGQRHCYTSGDANCAKAGTIVVTIIMTPLSYVGASQESTARCPSRAE
jgi:hypothetical protein